MADGRAETAAPTLEMLRERWDEVAARVARQDRVHGEWTRWAYPRSLAGGVLEVDAPISEAHT